MDMAAAKVGAVLALCKLTVAVWFQFTDLGPVVLLSGGVFFVILKCTVAMTEKCFCQYKPSLRLRENACVFLDTRVVNDR